MNTERIKEIQMQTAYPDSRSVQQALLQVWNECEQESKTANEGRVTVEDKGHKFDIRSGNKYCSIEKFTMHPLVRELFAHIACAKAEQADKGGKEPEMICGPTAGCGKSYRMVKENGGGFVTPNECPHCGVPVHEMHFASTEQADTDGKESSQ